MKWSALAVPSAFALAVAACGGSSGGGGGAAQHTPFPQMVNGGGPILTAPQIVTITFPNDAMVSRLEQFGDGLTTTNWWTQVAGEYGMGPGGNGGHVHVADAPPAQIADSTQGQTSDVVSFLQAGITAKTIPAPTAQSLYVVYYPAASTITLDGNQQSCRDFAGYHFTAQVTPPGGQATTVPYAVVPRCDDPTTKTLSEAFITTSASHEVLEAAQNVTPLAKRGWAMAADSAWGVILPESADLCANDDLASQVAFNPQPPPAIGVIVEGGFTYQRGWSNAAARAGHDPCVPALPNVAYFNAAPSSEILKMAVGASTTIDLDAFSEGTVPAWTVGAIDLGPLINLPQTLGFAFDKKTVQNGDKVKLTVTLKTAPPQGETIFWVVSKGTDRAHMWPVVVIQQ